MSRVSRKAVAGAASLMLAACLVLVAGAPAQASEPHGPGNCGVYAPRQGYIRTVRNLYEWQSSAMFRFKMSPAQIKGLRCFAEFLEIDFHIKGYKLPKEWERYSVTSNLPGAIHDVAFADPGDDVSPGAANIKTAKLVAYKDYYVKLMWNEPVKSGPLWPAVFINWVPSHWAWPYDPDQIYFYEPSSCAVGIAKGNMAWCTFAYANYSYSISKTWLKSTAYYESGFPINGDNKFLYHW